MSTRTAAPLRRPDDRKADMEKLNRRTKAMQERGVDGRGCSLLMQCVQAVSAALGPVSCLVTPGGGGRLGGVGNVAGGWQPGWGLIPPLVGGGGGPVCLKK